MEFRIPVGYGLHPDPAKSHIPLAACMQFRKQEGGGVDFKVVMIKSSHCFGLAANLSEYSLAGWAPVLRLRCVQPRTDPLGFRPKPRSAGGLGAVAPS